MLGHTKAWDTTDANALRIVDLVELGESPGELYIGMLNLRTWPRLPHKQTQTPELKPPKVSHTVF